VPDDNTHPQLTHITQGVDLTNPDDPKGWTKDEISHGTHCAGIIAGLASDQQGIRGFAPGAEVLILKVFPGGRFSNLIDALHREDIVSGDTSHARIHEFQVDTGATNSAGDFVYANGSIAWNEDKLFLGTKLIVEMEYQHAAVDQYARNVSPNIQEFAAIRRKRMQPSASNSGKAHSASAIRRCARRSTPSTPRMG
jgi:hypothetical protein